jgi:dTDP-4-dehydrorhamnose 3,5-epimerase
MIFERTSLGDAYVIDIEPRPDERGFFARTFCAREFVEHGLPTDFPQCNLSRNARAGTLRGMHYQAAPHREAKLVRCVRGAIYDVIVDLRSESPTYLQWTGVELTAENARALFVPEGFAHGFVTLRDDSDIFYHMGKSYVADAARGFRWNDRRFGIHWPTAPVALSPRDAQYADFDPEKFDG